MKPTRSKAKVENHPNLTRDLKTTAIVNNDKVAYERYMADRKARLSQKNEIDRLKEEIELLKQLITQQNK